MNKNRIIALLSISLTILCSYLIISGSSVLTRSILKEIDLPAGTFISWVGIICLQTAIYYSFPRIHNTNNLFLLVLAYLLKITSSIALMWGIISFSLAGNWSFNFNNTSGFIGSYQASLWFWRVSYLLIFLPLLSGFALTIYEIFFQLRNNSKTTK